MSFPERQLLEDAHQQLLERDEELKRAQALIYELHKTVAERTERVKAQDEEVARLRVLLDQTRLSRRIRSLVERIRGWRW